jgi:hypothetical protein
MNPLKIIYHDFKSYKFISILTLLNIVISAFVICFSYGLYQNYNVVIDEGESEQRELEILPTSNNGVEETSVTTKMLIDTLKSLSADTLKNIKSVNCDAIVATSAIEKNVFSFYFGYDGKTFYPCGTDSCFTDKQYNSFEKIVAINPALRTDDASYMSIAVADIGDEWMCNNIGDSQSIEIGGDDYKIVNEDFNDGVLIAPITAFYNDTPLRLHNGNWCVYLEFTTDISRSQYDDIVGAVAMNMGDSAKVPDMDISPASELFYYKTILLVSVMISVLAALNFAVLYRFVLQKRIKTLTIFRLCGCTKNRIVRLYLSECMLVGLPLFAVTEIAFDRLALPALSGIFEYIGYAYSPILYLAIFGIYAVSSFVVLLIMISVYVGNRTITQLKAGAV